MLDYLGIFLRIRKTYVNWPSVLLKTVLGRQIIHARMRATKEVLTLDRYSSIWLSYFPNCTVTPDLTSIGFVFNEHRLLMKLRTDRSHRQNGDIKGVFLYETYKWLAPVDKIVIDIGANVGDSSIYFALQGAKRVIALEPYPYSYRLALENIEVNRMASKIVLLNAAYGSDESLRIEDKVTDGSSTLEKLLIGGIRIPSYSLASLIERYHLKDVYLKMDCEGCEYSILRENESTFRAISNIQMEFHQESGPLVHFLTQVGFDTIVRGGQLLATRRAS